MQRSPELDSRIRQLAGALDRALRERKPIAPLTQAWPELAVDASRSGAYASPIRLPTTHRAACSSSARDAPTPAEPAMIMRDTVFTLSDDVDTARIERSIREMVHAVQRYVPGYRLKQEVQFERFGPGAPLRIAGYGVFAGVKTSVYLEVEGAGHYLPAFAGNLDIMTAAALATGERLALHRLGGSA